MVLDTAAPAKINLGLHVLRRRPDGYHDLESIFMRIGWADRIEARPAAELSLTCNDPALPTGEGNLVFRAARLLRERMAVDAGAALHLEKRVPYGAGLGGGSSDAAHTLRLLASLWGRSVSEAVLFELAERIGSDVPFFLGAPVSYVEGRGERLSVMDDYEFPFALVVARPTVAVPTADAYRHVRPHDADRPDLRALVRSNDLARWRRELVNDFEASVFPLYPQIATLKERMQALGAGYAAMSGSGSAVYGVFEADRAAEIAMEELRGAGLAVWSGRPEGG